MTREAQNPEPLFTGDDRNLSVTVYTTHTGNTPKDLTGATATYSVRREGGGALLFAAKTVGSGISNTNFATGIVLISIASADTANVRPGDYYHELEVVLGGMTVTSMTGRLRIKKSVAGAGA